MNEAMERTLLEALDLLERGASVDDILARYPDEADALRPFLLTATRLAALASQPTVAAQARSRRDFVAAAAQTAPPAPRRALRRLFAPLTALLLVAILAGGMLAGASGAALPGDALYETKRLVEEARLALTTAEQAAALREAFRQRRLAEVTALLADGREADVSISGTIGQLDGDRWLVDGVPVLIGPATRIDGTPAVGALVEIDGRTAAGALQAAAVRVLTGALPDATPTPPPPTPAVRATQNETGPAVLPAVTATDTDVPPTATTTATNTTMPTVTNTVAPTATNTAAPTSTATPPPTAEPPTVAPTTPPSPTSPPPPPTATPDNDNDDDNGNDNDDDNGGDNDNDDDDGGGNDNDDDNDGGGGNDNDDDNGDD